MGKGKTLLAEIAAVGLAVRSVAALYLLNEVSELMNERRLLRQDQQDGNQQRSEQPPPARPSQSSRRIVGAFALVDRGSFGARHVRQFTTHPLGRATHRIIPATYAHRRIFLCAFPRPVRGLRS